MYVANTNHLEEKEVEQKFSEIIQRDNQRIINTSKPLFSSLNNQDWVEVIK